MAIIRFLLKIPAILLMLICRIITVVIDLAAKVSCLVLGPITVFILGCAVYTICKHAWSQTFLLAKVLQECSDLLQIHFGSSFRVSVYAKRLPENRT